MPWGDFTTALRGGNGAGSGICMGDSLDVNVPP
jgi:hypothetical protein